MLRLLLILFSLFLALATTSGSALAEDPVGNTANQAAATAPESDQPPVTTLVLIASAVAGLACVGCRNRSRESEPDSSYAAARAAPSFTSEARAVAGMDRG